MIWEKCPRCNGTGLKDNPSLDLSGCFLCAGSGIVTRKTYDRVMSKLKPEPKKFKEMK